MKHRIVLCLLLALACCRREDMYTQEKAATWGWFAFLPNQMTMQAPVVGTVARGGPDVPVAQPATITEAMLQRGQQRFDIFCEPCHGSSGDGEGMIVQRGFPHPPELFSDALIKAKAQRLYDVITDGHGVMYSYGDRVPPSDRWAIVAYIRALQRSQRAPVAELPAQDKAHLPGAGS